LIYTTSISEKEALRILSALQKAGDSALREALANNIFLFRSLIQEETVSDRNSPIQVLRGPVKELKVKARALSENNIAAKLILEPTVPKEKECIRLVIHSFNSEQEIKKMLSILEK
jgi:8-amino-7-oxononanoate synthase